MAAGPGTIEKRYVRVPIAGKCVKFPYILKIFDIGRMKKLKKGMEQLSKKGDWLLLPELHCHHTELSIFPLFFGLWGT